MLPSYFLPSHLLYELVCWCHGRQKETGLGPEFLDVRLHGPDDDAPAVQPGQLDQPGRILAADAGHGVQALDAGRVVAVAVDLPEEPVQESLLDEPLLAVLVVLAALGRQVRRAGPQGRVRRLQAGGEGRVAADLVEVGRHVDLPDPVLQKVQRLFLVVQVGRAAVEDLDTVPQLFYNVNPHLLQSLLIPIDTVVNL